MNQQQVDLVRRLSKVLQRIPSDPSAGHLLIKGIEQAVAGNLVSVTDLGISFGKNDELDRLRKENADIRAAAPKSWVEFERLAETKGLKKLSDTAAAVGVEVAYLKTCRDLNRVPFTLVQKLADAPDESDHTAQRAKKAERRQSALEARHQAFEVALSNKDFLEFRLRHLNVPSPLPPEQAAKTERSEMTADEFREIIHALFPNASSDAGRCVLLSVITGYTEFSHRSHAGLLKMGGVERKPEPPSLDLAEYLRLMRRREEAHRRGDAMPEPVKGPKARANRQGDVSGHSDADGAAYVGGK